MLLVLFDEFLDHLKKNKKYSQNTFLAYKRDLSVYREFALNAQEDDDLQDFMIFMDERGLSQRSQARVISSLKTYFKFLQQEDPRQLTDNILSLINNIPSPRLSSLPPPILSLETFKKIYQACQTNNHFKTLRNQTTLLILFDLGLRVSQLIACNLQDINKENKTLKISKANLQYTIPLSDILLKQLKFYISKVRPHLKPEDVHALILNDKGKRASRIDIWRWLATWSKNAGLDEVVHPQQFRHGCAAALYKSGAKLESIQELLGHKRIESTKKYPACLSKPKIKESLESVVEKHHPLSQMPFLPPFS